MEHYGQPIVGSAEPLLPEDARRRLGALRAWGVDLSLVEASLRRTPTERVAQMLAMLRLVEALRDGYRKAIEERARPAQARTRRV